MGEEPKKVKLRKTPFSQVFIDNIDCYPKEQLEKILSMEPKSATGLGRKKKLGKLLDVSDFRDSRLVLFNDRNKSSFRNQ